VDQWPTLCTLFNSNALNAWTKAESVKHYCQCVIAWITSLRREHHDESVKIGRSVYIIEWTYGTLSYFWRARLAIHRERREALCDGFFHRWMKTNMIMAVVTNRTNVVYQRVLIHAPRLLSRPSAVKILVSGQLWPKKWSKFPNFWK